MKLAKLQSKSSAKTFAENEVIIKDGESEGDEMYIILTGSVGVYKNYRQPSEIKLTDLHPGSFFGEMTLFLDQPRAATVVAQETTVLLAINRGNAHEFFETETEMTYSLIRTLCQRLNEANTNLAVLRAMADMSPAANENDALAAAVAAVPAPNAPKPPPAVPAGLADLFPVGHGAYTHTPPAAQQGTMFSKQYECPLCGQSFPANAIRLSRLRVIDRDRDFRVRYEGIDTAYHETITCPHCCFTAFEGNIKDAIPSRLDVHKPEIARYKKDIAFGGDAPRTLTDVFAGYGLALKCARLFHPKAEIIQAKIHLRLAWLYEDCQDAGMALTMTKNAQEAYLAAFTGTSLGQDAAQQLCVLIGELSLRLDDFENAKTFFLNARMHRSGAAPLIKQAEEGIAAIKEREAIK